MGGGEIFRMLLPVIWMGVGTIVGLVLYRTTEAFFQQSEQSEKQTKQLRLVGSGLIAAIAYIGLWKSTEGLLASPSAGQVHVSAAAVENVQKAAGDAHDAMFALNGCVSDSAASQCDIEVKAVQRSVEATRQASLRLTPRSARR